jgi:hypothetical protein
MGVDVDAACIAGWKWLPFFGMMIVYWRWGMGDASRTSCTAHRQTS